MGSGASTQNAHLQDADETAVDANHWKLMPSSQEARQKYEKDGTLSKKSATEHLELRILLDETLGQQALGAFAKKCQALDIFMCWVDIQEFKAIPTIDYRRSKALHIYHKYIKPGAILEIGAVDSSEKDAIKVMLDEAKLEPASLSANCYDHLQSKCFVEMYHNIFKPFRDCAEEYLSLMKELKNKYNRVTVDDFDYIGKLGEGGFGLVVHVKKRSTGKHYAMKIQTKLGLLESFQDDPWRVDFEKQAFASCHHPFIVGLDYAFQTDQFAFMVLGLSTAGDLSQQLKIAPDGCLPEDRVKFYAAEIVLALIYLHEMGIIYRDLKPNNVLLNADGHVQLVDLGGVVDERGEVLGKKDEAASLLLLRQHFSTIVTSGSGDKSAADVATTCTNSSTGAVQETVSTVDADAEGEGQGPGQGLGLGLGEGGEGGDDEDWKGRPKPKRKLSIMGTFGYMAPEMVVMMSQSHSDMVGYNECVDWWSLGVTVYKLLTGERPFNDKRFKEFVDICGTVTRQVANKAPEYAMLFQEVVYPPTLSRQAVSFMEQLLDVNDNSRLGAGRDGVKSLKTHPFFEGIDWELLEQRHMVPPFKPLQTFDDTQEDGTWSSFNSMMVDLKKDRWLRQEISIDEQRYFATWDFVSPYTLRRELGLSHQMSQYDQNFKLRKLLGSPAP